MTLEIWGVSQDGVKISRFSLQILSNVHSISNIGVCIGNDRPKGFSQMPPPHFIIALSSNDRKLSLGAGFENLPTARRLYLTAFYRNFHAIAIV